MADNWRTIDVDQYDEDAYTEDEILAEYEIQLPADQVESLARTRSTDVRNYQFTRGDPKSALLRSLDDPPYGRHLAQAKIISTQTVIDALNLVKANDIVSTISSLSIDQQDLLMKYLYAGLARPELYNSAVLLTWHEKLTEAAGVGCIVRVMSDKRTVL
ncbi:actin-related protein 2/3 complex subunit 5 [Dichotomocladium elegans]|nr:actin-related protein 2/3 complex subunit 5 [Dichotomocladium elegans]